MLRVNHCHRKILVNISKPHIYFYFLLFFFMCDVTLPYHMMSCHTNNFVRVLDGKYNGMTIFLKVLKKSTDLYSFVFRIKDIFGGKTRKYGHQNASESARLGKKSF